MEKHGIVHFHTTSCPNIVVAEVLEPSSLFGPHSTLCHVGDKCYGVLGTRHLPAEIARMPLGAARTSAVEAHRREQRGLIRELALAKMSTDPEVGLHMQRTPARFDGMFRYEWNDPEFYQYIRDCEDPATYFAVKWSE
jgi:hypothetical protein